MLPRYPSYLRLAESGELDRRAKALAALAEKCELCPRRCGVRRREGQAGYCRAGYQARVASHNVHRGEEPPISATQGSGTVFFAHCTMRCLFCQNYPISQLGNGSDTDDRELAEMFLGLQRRGCHNLNLVTPTHYAHAFVGALAIAVEGGFHLPIVYNTSGYERVEVLRLLDGIVDIYMPDIKYGNPALASQYSDAVDFIDRNIEALREMHAQVGELTLDDEGVALRGLLVRHLVLPGAEEDSIAVLKMLCDEVSPRAHVSVMSQYFPANRAPDTPPLDRRVDPAAYEKVVQWVESTDLRGWLQPPPE
jgi:putative pyruvate formate lyase activating enzyme